MLSTEEIQVDHDLVLDLEGRSSATNNNTDEAEEKPRGVTPENSRRDLHSAHLFAKRAIYE